MTRDFAHHRSFLYQELKGLLFPDTELLDTEKEIVPESSGRAEAVRNGLTGVFGTMFMIEGLIIIGAVGGVRVVESEKSFSFRVLEQQPI
jgi:hypothetical protein